LLCTHVFIVRHEHVKSLSLGECEKLTVGNLFPAGSARWRGTPSSRRTRALTMSGHSVAGRFDSRDRILSIEGGIGAEDFVER
jgi:hypothetical protein